MPKRYPMAALRTARTHLERSLGCTYPLSATVKASQASAVNASVLPLRSLVSRTMTTLAASVTSTQLPPC